jgi:hypothetical protein
MTAFTPAEVAECRSVRSPENNGPLARERREGGQVRARGVADQPDTLRIETEFGGLGAHELLRGLVVVDGTGPSLHPWLHQPVLDRKDGIAVFCEVISPMRIEFVVADLPSAAVNANQHRRLAEAFRQIEIAEQTHALVLGKHDIGSGRHLIFSRRYLVSCHQNVSVQTG